MERANPGFVDEVRALGASDLCACYSCGACSAVCPLSKDETSFPRKMIRYAMLGLEGRILSAPEPWLCYYCGECSKTCPREADPGSLMMALRRYAIRRYSVGRVADAFYSAFASGIAWIALTVAAIALIVLFHDPNMNREKVEFLSFISLDRIHVAGIAIVSFIGAAFLANISIMCRAMRRGGRGAARPRSVLLAGFAYAAGSMAAYVGLGLLVAYVLRTPWAGGPGGPHLVLATLHGPGGDQACGDQTGHHSAGQEADAPGPARLHPEPA